MKLNRNFKDSVFTALFKDPDLLRELYCALEGVTLPPDTPVSINTLENVLYMDLYNDISFEISGKIVVLIEQQSTINPNLALRLLLYITRILEKRIKSRALYSTKKLFIPCPEFFVLYNGKEPYPSETIIRLSDLFEKPQELGLPEKSYPLLELEVKVININEGMNEAILNRSKNLSEYSKFVSVTHRFLKEKVNKEEAAKETISYCQNHGILDEFLEIHSSEMLNMLLTEWDTEEAKKVWYEDGWDDGHIEGRVEGQAEGRIEGQAVGREESQKEIAQNALARGLIWKVGHYEKYIKKSVI